jgi:hypothetical protein
MTSHQRGELSTGVGEKARSLLGSGRLAIEGEKEWVRVAILPYRLRKIHRSSVDSRWGAGLETLGQQAEILKVLGHFNGWTFSRAASRHFQAGTDVDPAPQEGAGGDDDCTSHKPTSVQRRDTIYTLS